MKAKNARDANDTTPISSHECRWIERRQPAGSPRIGTEHEKIAYYKATRAPFPTSPAAYAR